MPTGSKITLLIVLVLIGGMLGLKLAQQKPSSSEEGLVRLAPPSTAAESVTSSSPEAPLSPARQALAQAQQENQPALLLFHSTTCKQCKEMEALLEEIKPTYEGKVPLIQVLTDDPQEESLVREYQVLVIPTTFLLNRQGEPVKDHVGIWGQDELEAELQGLIEE